MLQCALRYITMGQPHIFAGRYHRSRVCHSTSSEVSLRAQLECQKQIHVISPTVIPEYSCRVHFLQAETVAGDQEVLFVESLRCQT